MRDIEKGKIVKILAENIETEGKIVEIEGPSKFFIEILPSSRCLPGELTKRGTISYEYGGKKYVIGGKVHCQTPYRIVFTAETNPEEEKRKELRVETPAIPVEISYKKGIFHKENLRGEILDLSLKGASIEISVPLQKGIIYSISCKFPYKHKTISFSGKCILKHIREYRHSYICGIEFTEIDPISFENLRKYLNHLKGATTKDTLNL